MRTTEIIKAIQNLPVQKRIYVIEKSIHSIRQQEDSRQLQKASDELYTDYKSDRELTAFTNIDFENFYEAR